MTLIRRPREAGLLLCAGALAVTACGDGASEDSVPGAAVAEQLDEAAEQSDPVSREVLEEEADEARSRDRLAPAGEPGSFAQDALDKAADASRPDTEPTAR